MPTILAPPPVAAFDVEDEMFDLDLRIVPVSVVPEPTAGVTEGDNCVMTDLCPTRPLQCR